MNSTLHSSKFRFDAESPARVGNFPTVDRTAAGMPFERA
jgi:hypothetical protein